MEVNSQIKFIPRHTISKKKRMSSSIEKSLLTAFAALAYYLTFKVNQALDPWFLYGQGITLLFLPAGIKHVSILLAGRWGALGSFIGLLFMVPNFWPHLGLGLAVPYAAISTLATWVGIAAGLHWLGVDRNLKNLKLIHLPLIDLLTTALHALVTNGFFVVSGLKKIDEWGVNTLAMMFGDFLGSLSMMLVLFLVLKIRPGYAGYRL